MGMTIKVAMMILRGMYNHYNDTNIDAYVGVGFCEEENDAIETALDTMKKYQQIQEIIRWNDAPSPYYKPDGQLFREICEVLEDGNDKR